MKRRNRPGFPGPDYRLPLQRGPGHPLGFLRTIQGKIAQLKKEAGGLVDRLRYRYTDGVPAAYKGEVVFEPQRDPIVLPGNPFGNNETVNIVVSDGMLHSVPVVLPGPGVFMARYLHVTFYQRVAGGENNGDFTNQAYKTPLPLAKQFEDDSGSTNSTLKWSICQFQSELSLACIGDVNSGNPYSVSAILGTNFFWNLIDRDSERRVADELVSSQVLLPQSSKAACDGALFEFPVPWLFERAGIVEFQFQLINPILQFDSSLSNASPVRPFPFDDREVSLRNQDVTVRVELHGTKFYSERDQLLREAV